MIKKQISQVDFYWNGSKIASNMLKSRHGTFINEMHMIGIVSSFHIKCFMAVSQSSLQVIIKQFNFEFFYHFIHTDFIVVA